LVAYVTTATSSSVVVSVAVSKLGKTDLVFVQSGAKINSVYYLPLRKLNSVLFSSVRCIHRYRCVAVSAVNRRVYRNCYTLLLGRLLFALASAVIDRFQILADNRGFCLRHLHSTPPLRGRRRNIVMTFGTKN